MRDAKCVAGDDKPAREEMRLLVAFGFGVHHFADTLTDFGCCDVGGVVGSRDVRDRHTAAGEELRNEIVRFLGELIGHCAGEPRREIATLPFAVDFA